MHAQAEGRLQDPQRDMRAIAQSPPGRGLSSPMPSRGHGSEGAATVSAAAATSIAAPKVRRDVSAHVKLWFVSQRVQPTSIYAGISFCR